MPTVNLPFDDRWGQVGKGLGAVIGGVLQGYQQNQVQQGVAQVMSDTSISEDKKPGEIFKKFGNSGIETLAKLNALKEQQATITQKLAGAGLTQIQTEIARAKAGVAPAQAQADLAKAQAEPAHVAAETESLSAGAAATRALTGPRVDAEQALSTLRMQEARKTGVGADIEEDRLRRMRAGPGTGDGLDAQLAPFKLTPEETAAAKMTYQGAETKVPGSGEAAMSAYARNLVIAKEKREAPKPATEGDKKVGDASVQHATSALRFIDDFKRGGASQLGLLSGANFTTTMERYGWATGDVPLVDMWNAAQQQVASTATAGGGFFSGGRVKLAHDVTAGITETPLHALLATDQVADRMIASLESRISGSEGTSTNTKPLQIALDKWKQVKATTGTFKSDTTADGQRTIAYFEGKQIDPKTFKVLLDPEKVYDIGGGRHPTGAAIAQKAREAGKDPATALEEYRNQFKYTGPR
jgi:hypothetical protein